MNMAPGGRGGKRVHVYRSCCARLVKNIHRRLLDEKTASRQQFGTTQVSNRLLAYTGLSKATIYHLLKDSNVPTHDEPEQRDRGLEMQRDDECQIRPAIIGLLKDKRTPTVSSLHRRLKATVTNWKWGRTSLYKALLRLGFRYNSKRHNYYDRLRESDENIVARNAYLKRYFDWKAEGRPMVYMDESWINKNAAPTKSWHDGTAECVDAVPPGKGARWILIGAGTEDGWVPNSYRMWKGNVKSEDYHTEMNGPVFKDWVHKYLLPNIAPNSVIVMDRATYHTELRPTSKKASSSLRKADLVKWVVDHECKDDNGQVYTAAALETMRKPSIFAIAHANPPQVRWLIFDWLAEWNTKHNTDIKLNALPVAHPTLNPIEMLWNWLKRHVATNNHDFSMTGIASLAQARKEELDGAWWKKACAHSHKFAVDYYAADDEGCDEDPDQLPSSHEDAGNVRSDEDSDDSDVSDLDYFDCVEGKSS